MGEVGKGSTPVKKAISQWAQSDNVGDVDVFSEVER
jgi:hypothetical protein